ncbi:hypothetical protein LTR85_002168 [Meristemomyces frigidus]|nr:hypothetical protein LTR85_002168 [Meristemomyces frigidus]
MACVRCTATTNTGQSCDRISVNQPLAIGQASSVCAACNTTYDDHGRPVNKRAAVNKAKQARAGKYCVLLTAILESMREGTPCAVLERVLDAMGGALTGDGSEEE